MLVFRPRGVKSKTPTPSTQIHLCDGNREGGSATGSNQLKRHFAAGFIEITCMLGWLCRKEPHKRILTIKTGPLQLLDHISIIWTARKFPCLHLFAWRVSDHCLQYSKHPSVSAFPIDIHKGFQTTLVAEDCHKLRLRSIERRQSTSSMPCISVRTKCFRASQAIKPPNVLAGLSSQLLNFGGIF